MRDFGHLVDDRAPRHGGHCEVVTRDGSHLPFRYKDATIYCEITYPTAGDLERYDVIELTAPHPWDPSEQDDPPDVEPSQAYADAYSHLAPMSSNPATKDWEAIRPCLGWKPINTIQKTFEATTQDATNTVCLPM